MLTLEPETNPVIVTNQSATIKTKVCFQKIKAIINYYEIFRKVCQLRLRVNQLIVTNYFTLQQDH